MIHFLGNYLFLGFWMQTPGGPTLRATALHTGTIKWTYYAFHYFLSYTDTLQWWMLT